MATAHRYEELEAWQLSAELRNRVLEISATWQARDRRFYEQLRDAACSGLGIERKDSACSSHVSSPITHASLEDRYWRSRITSSMLERDNGLHSQRPHRFYN